MTSGNANLYKKKVIEFRGGVNEVVLSLQRVNYQKKLYK